MIQATLYMNLLNHGVQTYLTKTIPHPILNNTTLITAGTFLANKPFEPYQMFRATAAKNPRMLEHLWSEFSVFKNKKRVSQNHKETLSMLIANLILAINVKRPIRQKRGTVSGRVNREIQDFLAHKGFINLVIGKGNEYDKQATWFVPSGRFELISESSRIDYELKQGYTFVHLREAKNKAKPNAKRKDLPLPDKTQKDRQLVKSLSRPVRAYNALWLNHDVTLDGTPILPFCRRIFNMELSLGGRFYAYGDSYMNMKKEHRAQLLMDGYPTIEPDFKALHFALLYYLAGFDMFSLFDDAYEDVRGYDRVLIKALSVRFVNSSPEALKSNITKSGNPKMIALAERKEQGRYLNKGQLKSLEGFIEGVPVGTKGQDVYDAMEVRHPDIMELIVKPNIGLELQKLDSDIMAYCSAMLSSQDIPHLPVHDSVRCKVTDSEKVVGAMTQSYKKVTGFYPKITGTEVSISC